MKHLSLLLAACLAAPLAAQNAPKAPGPPDAPRGGHGDMMHQHMMPGGMSMGMGMMHDGMPMQGLMVFAPQHLLGHRAALELTAQQVTRLEALRDAVKPAHDKAANAARAAGDSLQAALGAANPDTVLARRLFLAHHNAMGEAHWSMLKVTVQAKAVLTDAQRARVEGWADEMHDGHR